MLAYIPSLHENSQSSSHYLDLADFDFSAIYPDTRHSFSPTSIPRSITSEPDYQLMSTTSQPLQNPPIRIQSSSPLADGGSRAQQHQQQQYMLAHNQYMRSGWGNSDVHLSPSTYSPQKGQTSAYHKRSPSASSVASGGPPSPQDLTNLYPYIVSSDSAAFSPSSFDSFATAQAMPKSLPTPDTPTQTHFSAADYQNLPHTPQDGQSSVTMRKFANTGRSPNDDNVTQFTFSAAPSVSSISHHNSPATPQTIYDGELEDAAKGLQNHAFNPQLSNMPQVMSAAPSFEDYYSQLQNLTQAQRQQLVAQSGAYPPYKANLAHRVQNTQLDRSASRGASPATSIPRESSPYRQTTNYGQPVQMSNVAAPQRLRANNVVPSQFSSRQVMNNTALLMQQQQQQPRPAVSQAQEQPKTVSPKDIEYDYTGPDETPLFPLSQQTQFSLPREESNYSTSSNFGGNQQNQYYTPVSAATQNQTRSFLGQRNQQQGSVHSTGEPSLPDFPAHLTSMETTVSSDSGQDQATQFATPRPAPAARPRDTSTDSGTYACTQSGCTLRFDNPLKLQKHKRESHGPSGLTSSLSAVTTSPAVAHNLGENGHVSSATAIANRNAQTGPHRCDRINPSTGKACNSVFSRPYDLTRHEDTIHNNRKHKVRCHLCTEEKTFSRNDALTRHMRVVHPEVDWPGKTKKKGRD